MIHWADTLYDPESPIEQRRAAKFNMETGRKNTVNPDDSPEFRVEVPARFIPVEELPKTVHDVAVLIPGCKAKHSRTFEEGAVFKSGAREGEKRPDKLVDHYSIGYSGAHPLTAVWSGGKMQYAKAYRDGELLYTELVTELKGWIKGGWE